MLLMRYLAGGAAAVALAVAAPAAPAADRSATPANLASVFGAAQGGDVIHLGAGEYGTFGGAAKAATVTLRADPGVTASIAADLDGASNLRFENLHVTSATLVRSTSIQFVGNTFTGGALIDTTSRDGDHAILFDGNTHDGITVCSSCYEGRITVHGSAVNTTPVGVTIRNSRFGGGGNSDGIQVGSFGVEVLDNEFADLPQGDPSLAHTDAIQLYGQTQTVIRGNYMHNVATGILCGDGCNREVIENNVIDTIGSYPGVLLGPDRDSIVRHNTLVSSPVRVDEGNGPGASSGTIIKDNIVDSYILAGSGLATDFNLITDGSRRGGADVLGRPRFSGGARPTSLVGYRLAEGSPGRGTASDGNDRGAIIGTSGTPAAPRPPVRTPSAHASAPAPTLAVPRRVSWDRLRRGLRLRVRSAQAVELTLTLVPSGRRRALAHRHLAVPAGTRTVVLRPERRLLGRRRDRALTLRARIAGPGATAVVRTFAIRVRA